MTASIIDGKELAKKVRREAKEAAARLLAQHGRSPGLTVVLVGDDAASQVYVGKKEKAATKAGFRSQTILLPASTTREELLSQLHSLNDDDAVDGILLQLPLPSHLDEREMLEAIDPAKDVDGFHPINQGNLLTGRDSLVPCTPMGMVRMLDEIGADLSGKHAVVLGRSNIVGKPIALLLLARNATVTICHSRTADLAAEVGRADVLVAAVGRKEMVHGDWIKPGAIVLDVGINRGDDGKLYGDVHFDSAAERAGWITPVPGGVGPMTVACLLQNTTVAAERRMSR